MLKSSGVSNNRQSIEQAQYTFKMTEQSPASKTSGRVAVISGSNSGIGAAVAVEMANKGIHIVVNYPFASLRSEAEELVASLATKSIAVQADISTKDEPAKLVQAAIDAFGRLDIVVNNAGIGINLPLEQQTLEHWDSLVNLNTRGPFLLTQAALKVLSKENGRIINICSASSRAAPPLQTIYAGTKGMLDSFTRCWAKELPPKYGCTVNAVSPGPTTTAGFSTAGDEFMSAMQGVIDATPAGKRLGMPEDIAYAVSVLCDEKASWMNGVHLHVNGGLFID